jgi:ATP-dependent RNA helicase DHX36
VIDTGRVKENRYDDLNKMPTLTECWASKAATTQRRGRAGRVKPGYCWHLYSTHTHDNVLDDYQLPEMLRVGLEDLVLQILVLDLGEPAQFLTRAVDPPTDMSIKNALQLLESLGAAECDWDPTAAKDQSCLSVTTSLTALGYLLASIPVHPRVGKLLIYGNLFGVYDDCLTIAASMSSRSPFMSSLSNREAADKAKRGFASDDHIAVLLAFNSWMELRHRDGQKAKIFLRNNFMSYHALSNIIQLRKQLAKYMSDVGFRSTLLGTKSSERDDIHLVRAVIAAGLYPNIIIAPETLSGKVAGEVVFRGREINDIYLHPSATSYTAKVLDSRYGCYHEIMKTSRIYVRDLTPVSKFALLLFGGDLKVFQTHSVVAVDGWLKFRVDAKPATLVKYLRSSLETLLLTKIMNPAIDVALSPKGKSVISAVAALLKMEGGK